jgi:hypothetical protein
MGAIEGKVVGESALKHPPPAARNWSQSRPEQTVVDDEKIYPVLHRRADRTRGNIDRGANPRCRTGIFDLQTIERIRPVGDLSNSEEVVAIIDQLMELGHAAHCERRKQTMHAQKEAWRWSAPEASWKLAGGANHRLCTQNAPSSGRGDGTNCYAASAAPAGARTDIRNEPVVCTTG